MSAYDDLDNWQHLRDEAQVMARMTGRMFYVIGAGRPAKVWDSRDKLPYQARIDWVAFPGRRHGRG